MAQAAALQDRAVVSVKTTNNEHFDPSLWVLSSSTSLETRALRAASTRGCHILFVRFLVRECQREQNSCPCDLFSEKIGFMPPADLVHGTVSSSTCFPNQMKNSVPLCVAPRCHTDTTESNRASNRASEPKVPFRMQHNPPPSSAADEMTPVVPLLQHWPRGPDNELHRAARAGATRADSSSALERLDRHQSRRNQGDLGGWTPLMFGAFNDSYHVVEILLNNVADSSIKAGSYCPALILSKRTPVRNHAAGEGRCRPGGNGISRLHTASCCCGPGIL